MEKCKYNIVVSGAAVLKPCCKNIKEISKELGRQVAKRGHTLVTGATTGVPYYAALGCKEVGGFNIGFSPASSEKSHIKTYKLPLDAFNLMIYTGGDYAGRDITMTKSADAIIIVCGRMGTLHEFTTAIECKKPVGVLEGTGGAADKIKELIKGIYSRLSKTIIFEKDPDILVDKLINIVATSKKENKCLIED
jgi:uncharacterized protein (TIGR00725 family)